MYPVGIARHMVNRRHERIEEHYSILNSESHYYGLLHYYIKLKWQVAQLNEIGFREIQAVGLDGRSITEAEYSNEHRDLWIYYVCRK